MKRVLLLLTVLILLLTALISCSFKIPGAPIWTIEVIIPFSQRTYRMSEMITDSTKMAEDGYGLLFGEDGEILQFVYQDTLEYQLIGDKMNYGASDTGDYNNEIGLLVIEAPQPDTSFLPITSALTDTIIGYEGTIPPFNLPVTDDTLHFNIFNWISVNEGWIYLRLVNGFPFPVENVTVSLENIQDGFLIGAATFPGPILANRSAIDSLDIGGGFIYNDIKMTMEGRAIGTYRTVQISGDENLIIETSIGETKADSAYAEIQPQDFSQQDTLEYDDHNHLVEAVISSGWIYTEIENNIPIRTTAITHYQNILTQDNEILIDSCILEPGTLADPWKTLDSTDLTGHSVIMTLNDQNLRIISEAITEDSRITRYQGFSYQKITKNQALKGQYWTNELRFQTFTGILDSIYFNLPVEENRMNLPINIRDIIENIEFIGDTLFINTENGLSIPMLFNAEVRSVNYQDHTTVAIPIVAVVPPGLSVIKIPDGDRLTSIMPDVIRFSGTARSGARFFPDLSVEVITLVDTNGVGGNLSMTSELKFVMSTATIKTEPVKLEGSLDFPIESIQLDLTLTNSIPLGGNMKLLMGTDTTSMDTIIQIELPRSNIVNHRAVAAQRSYLIELGDEEMDIIKQPDVYTRQFIVLESTLPDTVRLYGADSLDVRAKAIINYIVDPGDNYED
ncbi:MAG: hypothetical protein P9X24_19715 [Candidatus Hatepunaea meridiana]|nr:hypothetical protein [Candidatus Hatepunaea meridiana]